MNLNFDEQQWKKLVLSAGIILMATLLAWLLTKLNKKAFQRLQGEQKSLHLSFARRVVNALIFIVVLLLAVSCVFGSQSVWQTLLGSTAVISAVAAFAAQDVIKDVLAGMMISLYKPFNLGDRIELEDGTTGIVEDITMRHVVLILIDQIRMVVPNSRLNAMLLHNYSYKSPYRSVNFQFPVSYDCDTEQAKRVIAGAIVGSEYAVPVLQDENGGKQYAPVYFLKLDSSALIMSVTVYYEKTSPTEAVKNDINTRVRAALLENHIEIPYNYITVINKNEMNRVD